MPENQADGLHPYSELEIGRFWRVIWYSHSIKSRGDAVQFDHARIVLCLKLQEYVPRNLRSTCGNSYTMGNKVESWDG
jgi:hypothetical protein